MKEQMEKQQEIMKRAKMTLHEYEIRRQIWKAKTEKEKKRTTNICVIGRRGKMFWANFFKDI
jgi:hypothetical protein